LNFELLKYYIYTDRSLQNFSSKHLKKNINYQPDFGTVTIPSQYIIQMTTASVATVYNTLAVQSSNDSAARRRTRRACGAAVRQSHDLVESAESADTAAILFELAISATVSSQLLQLHTAQCPSQPAAEHTFFAVPSMSGRGGGCARGPNGGRRGGTFFQM
jgi:hypothetical protein